MSVVPLIAVLAALSRPAEPPERIAVLVGSNQPARGRTALRYAHQDVRSVAEVLVQAGRFARADVHLLLDPDADKVLQALDDALGALKRRPGETMLLFYYSGHADDHALYVKGAPLPLDALRARLDKGDSAVRIGVLDACRGGAWTRTKGLSPQAPFEVEIPLKLSSEGSVLIASSSGAENAHEADSLRGSFFTHHLVAGLRGAADASGDGVVTLNEAYAYAKERTVRDTAVAVDSPQHPSFSMNLRGRSDLPLTAMANSTTVVSVEEKKGPLQLIHVGTGLKVLELPEGQRRVLLAVAPGRYVLRRKDEDGIHTREFTLAAHQSVTLHEDTLTLEGSEALTTKGPSPAHASSYSTLPGGKVELLIGGGVAHYMSAVGYVVESAAGPAFEAQVSWGLNDRVQVSVLTPGVSYRFGLRGHREWVATGGLSGWAITSPEGFYYAPTARLDFRQWFGESSALNAVVALSSVGAVGGTRRLLPESWSATLGVGYTHALGERVTLNLSVSWEQLAFGPQGITLFTPDPASMARISFGAGRMGFRPLPLVQLHVGPVLSLYGDASFIWDFPRGHVYERYMAGASWVF